MGSVGISEVKDVEFIILRIGDYDLLLVRL